VKTKHPQLHYESKLYMLLQGGSKFLLSFLLLLADMFIFLLSQSQLIYFLSFFFLLKLVFLISNGLELRVNTMSWLLTFLDQASKTCLIIAIESYL
jgi:hypothetical protein